MEVKVRDFKTYDKKLRKSTKQSQIKKLQVTYQICYVPKKELLLYS
jgi:hypothetical protein